MFTFYQLPVIELREAVALWMWERHGIDAKHEDVSFECADNELLQAVIKYDPPGDVDARRTTSGRLVSGEDKKET